MNSEGLYDNVYTWCGIPTSLHAGCLIGRVNNKSILASHMGMQESSPFIDKNIIAYETSTN